MIELPSEERRMPDGLRRTFPGKAMDRDVRQLVDFAARMVERARRTPSRWLVQSAHILRALAAALSQPDLDALEEPHRWARSRLRHGTSFSVRLPSGEFIPVGSTLFLPLESDGRPTTSFAGGFNILARLLKSLIALSRDKKARLETFTEAVTNCLTYSFPGVRSLVEAAECDEEAMLSLHQRVHEQLAVHWKKLAVTGASEFDADEIAEALVRTELERSGKSRDEMRKALGFLKQRRLREDRGGSQ